MDFVLNRIVLLALSMALHTLCAQPTLTIGTTSALPGTLATVDITLQTSEPVAAVEFDFMQPSPDVLSMAAAPGNPSLFSLACSSELDLLHCLVVNHSSTPLPDGTKIAIVSLGVADTLAADVPLRLSRLIGVSPTGNPVTVTAIDGVLMLGSGPCDLNRDGDANVIDVTIVVNAVLNRGTCGPG